MTRPRKNTVDFFPHDCNGGRTITILEQRFQNDGYATWFKILELLGRTDGHFYDCSDPLNWEYLKARALILDDERLTSIIDLLAAVDAIDKELWTERRIIWSDNFARNLEPVYQKRTTEIPCKPSFRGENPTTGGKPAPEIRTRAEERGEERRVEESRVEESLPDGKHSGTEESVPADLCPHQKIIELYHQELPMLRRVKAWNGTRQEYLRARWREDPERQTLEWWTVFFRMVKESDFLTGKSPPADGRKPFQADLEWLVRPQNFIKVLEGKYENWKGGDSRPRPRTMKEAQSLMNQQIARMLNEKRNNPGSGPGNSRQLEHTVPGGRLHPG